MIDRVTVDAARADLRSAAAVYDDAGAWLEARPTLVEPLGAEVWVFDPSISHVLLVEHRRRGWVPPGGVVDPGETPRQAAARELAEETGVVAQLLPEPAAVAVRSFDPAMTLTASFSYAAVVDRDVTLVPEEGQPASWISLDEGWQSVFPQDVERIRAYAARLRSSTTAR